MIGETVGSYRIDAPLGAGGMGEVWYATHVLLGSAAAIKVLRPECSESKGIVQRFFDEARAATRIAHPSIVTVFDFGWHDGRAFLVMELLRGDTLARAIRAAGTLPPARALRLLRRCADAMAAAHAAGIVHRDLKPDNIFLLPDPLDGERVKILDFGIAKLLGDDPTHTRTQTGMIMGTPAYMSPEQCRGASGVDHRTDVYALGCVLFHMLTGRPPFVGATPADLIAAHLTAEPPAVSALVFGISGALDALVARCLAKDADARIGSMAALAAAIEAVDATQAAPVVDDDASATRDGGFGLVSGGATTMQRGAGESMAQPPPPRRRGAIGIVLAVAALAIGATIAIIASKGDGQPAARTNAAGAAPVDAGVVIDAPAAAVIDASIDAPVASDTTGAVRGDGVGSAKPGRPTGPRRGSGSGSGSSNGSGTRPVPPAGSGSGSGSGSAYDPYDDR